MFLKSKTVCNFQFMSEEGEEITIPILKTNFSFPFFFLYCVSNCKVIPMKVQQGNNALLANPVQVPGISGKY